MKILIMGLPGTGKTTLAQKLVTGLEAEGRKVRWNNADSVRKQWNDWDFTMPGRLRQAVRMSLAADTDVAEGYISINDFVAPTHEARELFNRGGRADLIIWMDTINKGRFEDTNAIFQQPTADEHDIRVRTYNDDMQDYIIQLILKQEQLVTWNNRAPTVQMLGRWQPWHDGHQALFERLLAKTGQVCIQIRDCQGWNDSNPFDVAAVEYNIHKALEGRFYGRYQVMVVPNIVHIGWGRGVGYTSGEETFDESITSISATQIRRDMGIG